MRLRKIPEATRNDERFEAKRPVTAVPEPLTTPRIPIELERGDRVKIKDGPFENFEGTVAEIIEGWY